MRWRFQLTSSATDNRCSCSIASPARWGRASKVSSIAASEWWVFDVFLGRVRGAHRLQDAVLDVVVLGKEVVGVGVNLVVPDKAPDPQCHQREDQVERIAPAFALIEVVGDWVPDYPKVSVPYRTDL
jgi:hypothetical protein